MMKAIVRGARRAGSLLAGLLALAFAATVPAAAQDSEVYVEQVSPAAGDVALSRIEALGLIDARLPSFGHAALQTYLARDGRTDGHFALITQDGKANRITLSQTGQTNVAVIEQYGARHQTELLQAGHGNVYSARLRGTNLTLNVAQEGSGNVYLLDFDGGSGHEAAVLQRGDRNRAVQLGAGSAPFSIEQIGSDMQLIIRHNEAQ